MSKSNTHLDIVATHVNKHNCQNVKYTAVNCQRIAIFFFDYLQHLKIACSLTIRNVSQEFLQLHTPHDCNMTLKSYHR